MYFVPEGQHDSSQARSAWTGVWTFREGKTRRQAASGAERSRAHCIIGVPPVFPPCAKGNNQKPESQTWAPEPFEDVEPSFRKHSYYQPVPPEQKPFTHHYSRVEKQS